MANFATPPNYRAKVNLRDLADLSLSQGDILYFDGTNLTKLSPGTSGQYLKTQGAGANPIWADVSASVDYINNIGDVVITSPADNEVLAYDSTSGNWINQTPAEAGLAEASHTHAASDITSGQIGATYGGTGLDTSASTGIPKVTSGVWSIDATTDDLTEGTGNLYYTDARARAALSATAPITYDSGTGAIELTTPLAASYGGTGLDTSASSGVPVISSGTWSVGANLNDLGDVSISSPSDGQVLTYNSTSGKWENQIPSSGGFTSRVRAYQSVSQSISSWEKVNFQTEVFDGNGEWDTTNSRFQPSANGYYLVIINIRYSSGTTYPTMLLQLQKKDWLSIDYWRAKPASSDITFSVSTIVYLTVSDYIEVYAYNSSSISTTSGEYNTWICIYRLS